MKLFLLLFYLSINTYTVAAQQESKTKEKQATTQKNQIPKKEHLKTVQDKLSYVLGYDVGQKMISDMSSKELMLNTKVFLKAVADAFEGKQPVLSDIEARNTMILFEQLMKATPEERKKLQKEMFESKK